MTIPVTPPSATAGRTVRILVVGCGAITTSSHLPAILKSNRVKLAGVIDSDLGRARQLLRTYGISSPVSQRVGELLPESDGVLIATPNHTHAPIAEPILRAGIPVLIEKPFTTTSEDGRRLCELAQQTGACIAIGFRTRFHPNVRLMKRRLEQRYFGRIGSFHYEFGSRGGWAPVSAYNLDRAAAGGGVLTITGTHFLDRMLYWFGDPEILSFEDDSFGGVEANCRARVRYRDGDHTFEGTLQFSKTCALKNGFVLKSERGRVALPENELREISYTPAGEDAYSVTLHPGAWASSLAADPFQAQVEDFADCIVNRRLPEVDGWNGLKSVELVENLYRMRTAMPEPWAWYAGGGKDPQRG